MKKISVILPVFNESLLLPSVLQSLARYQDGNFEVIVADGGSSDGTLSIAKQFSDKVVLSPKGRGIQMNQGANLAEGEILLFLHADSTLDPKGLDAIRESLRDDHMVGGAFRLSIDSSHWGLRLVSFGANLRTALSRIPYGDQGIFVRKKVFDRMGGFQDLPFMEELDFFRRLKKEGKVSLLRERIRTSPRRWYREGILKVTLRNQVFLALYYFGVSPHRLVRWYQALR